VILIGLFYILMSQLQEDRKVNFGI